MLEFKEELKTHNITPKQVADKADVDFCDVYKFSSGAFTLIPEEAQIKIVQALSVLTDHRYKLSDFVYHPNILPPALIPQSVAIPLGARGGKGSLSLVEELKRNGMGIQVWAQTTNASHRPKQSTQEG